MTQTYIGAALRRREDSRFLTGRATFVDDVKLPQMLHAAVLRSPHAHARILSINIAPALAIAGVAAVFTYDDIAPHARTIPVRLYPLPGLERFLQRPLAQDRVRYVGEAIALVVATNRYVAEDALALIEIDYEPLPAVVTIQQALQDKTVLHEGSRTTADGG